MANLLRPNVHKKKTLFSIYFIQYKQVCIYLYTKTGVRFMSKSWENSLLTDTDSLPRYCVMTVLQFWGEIHYLLDTNPPTYALVYLVTVPAHSNYIFSLLKWNMNLLHRCAWVCSSIYGITIYRAANRHFKHRVLHPTTPPPLLASYLLARCHASLPSGNH